MIDNGFVEKLDRPGHQHYQVVEAYLEARRWRRSSTPAPKGKVWLQLGPFGDGGQKFMKAVIQSNGPKREWED